MESANLYEHHHQLQPQLLYSSLASSSSSSSQGVSSLHDWSPSIVLDGYEFNRYMNEILPNSPSVKGPLLQEVRFGYARSYVHQPANNKLQFGNIKGSISDNFLKLSDMNRSSSFNSYSYTKNEHQDQDMIDLNQNLSWLSSFPDQKLSSRELYSNGESFARFGVAGLAPAASSFVSSCTDQSNDLYASGSLLSTSSPSLHLAADHILSYTNGVEGSNQSFGERNSSSYFHVQESSHSPSNSCNKTSTFRNEVPRTSEKLSACSAQEVVAKKPRLSSSSCPTLKVRKEKLGDRIAALHRLVSPFGKTDTASVLTEAIGYIQFLQDQIQTLSMSYLKSSRNKSFRNIRGDLTIKDVHHQKEDELNIRQDLRSRGLSLVPLAFTSYICSYNGRISAS